MDERTLRWLDLLGYGGSDALHVAGDDVLPGHGYAAEIQALLQPDGDVRASAVFDVDGVPTVCFVRSDGAELSAATKRKLRKAVWNQNLVTVILVVEDRRVVPLSVLPEAADTGAIKRGDASATGPFSRLDIESGEVQHRHPDWFKPEDRVDRKLLANLGLAVKQLCEMPKGLAPKAAQYLVGQTVFVSYLEHRGIVSPVYRQRHGLRPLRDLIRDQDRDGLEKLFKRLKEDLNGDFLVPNHDPNAAWSVMSAAALHLLDAFLAQTDLESQQTAFWGYDFRHIPVELLSGIYETFLAEEQEKLSAYYTPRHLATLVVKQALAHSTDPTREVIYDGACGSGILLTTAFRQILAYAEQGRSAPLKLKDRITLLRKTIFGSDVSEAACRVTALSLYLALLDGLDIQDLAELTTAGRRTLPELMAPKGENLWFEDQGDFFSPRNKLAQGNQATILISNPPWGEPKQEQVTTYDAWARKSGKVVVRRQVAMAFAHRTLSSVREDGRICLILPIGAMLAPTSQRFLCDWLNHVQIDRIINFGDLRRLLFPTAIHGCVVVLARPRKVPGDIPPGEQIEYWVPKADVSLALGRLSVYGRDRHRVSTQAVTVNNEILRTLYWGGATERELISRLSLMGSLSMLIEDRSSEWDHAKGFHVNDKHVPKAERKDTSHLQSGKYLDADRILHKEPVLDSQALVDFPAAFGTVAWAGAKDGAAFRGPRVVFPDGATSDLEVRAAYAEKPFSFKHSIGAIVGPKRDADTLRFLAAYLHSDLARFLLLHTAYSLAIERLRVSVKEVLRLPFCRPQEHPKRGMAERIVADLAAEMRAFERLGAIQRMAELDQFRAMINRQVNRYFGLSASDERLVADTCEHVIPSLQPTTYANLRTRLASAPHKAQCARYAQALVDELESWRRGLNGSGHFELDGQVAASEATRGFGIVKVTLRKGDGASRVRSIEVVRDQSVTALMATLRSEGMLEPSETGGLFASGAWQVVSGLSMYLIKPLAVRAWLASEAAADAKRLVDAARTRSQEIAA